MQLTKAILLCCLVGVTTTGFAAEKMIYGRYEKVKVMNLNEAIIPAKLDTGAMTASLSAIDIKVFKKNGEEWVRFTPQVKNQQFASMELPLVKMGKIKRRAADVDDDDKDEENSNYTYRPEVEMQLCMGDTLKTVRVNLTDRSAFSYPLLIGTSALKQFKAIVDPSLKYQSQATCTIKKAAK